MLTNNTLAANCAHFRCHSIFAGTESEGLPARRALGAARSPQQTLLQLHGQTQAYPCFEKQRKPEPRIRNFEEENGNLGMQRGCQPNRIKAISKAESQNLRNTKHRSSTIRNSCHCGFQELVRPCVGKGIRAQLKHKRLKKKIF